MAGPPRRITIATHAAAQVADRLEDRGGIEVVRRFALADEPEARRRIEGLRRSWAVVAGTETYDREVLEALPELRAILRFGVGHDAVDLDVASQLGVAVYITAGSNANAVADLTLGLMLACVRRILILDRAVRGSGAWPQGPSRDLSGATVTLVGFGSIGQAVARRLSGFGCRLLAVDPRRDRQVAQALGVTFVPLEEGLRRADLASLHTALEPGTQHLIGADELSLLSHHAVLINTARGALIDEHALVSALRSGQIAAAGVDVFEHEPVDPTHPLLGLPNVVTSGHTAAYSLDASHRTARAVEDCVLALLRGEDPTANRIN
jgi:D-3-phosphoglycerate dehydrogenase / 2-oxoglutarate reductase